MALLTKRRFLFLQGPATPFFARLADRLRADRHQVFKLVFNGGDLAYWSPRSCWLYRDGVQSLRAFLDDRYRRFGISDRILFGDRRPVHRVAVEHGETCGVRTHVYEEGYFRPSWVTLEREGVNGHSLLPRDPDWFLAAAKALPDPAESVPIRSPFRVRAAHDVGYHLAGVLNPLVFHRYRTHAPVNAPVEYAAYARRFSRLRMIRNREYRRVAELVASAAPYFVLPLQLNSDAQIRDHSRFEHMGEVIVHVSSPSPGTRRAMRGSSSRTIRSIWDLWTTGASSRTASGDSTSRDARSIWRTATWVRLRVMPSGWSRSIARWESLRSIWAGLPRPSATRSTICPPDLWQGGLDAFWTNGQSPDAQLYSSFRRVVMRATQVNGGFYCGHGIALAVKNSCPFFSTAERSPLEELL